MKKTFLAFSFSAAMAVSLHAAPMGTAFTYQGRLNDGGTPANGSYVFRFTVYGQAVNGNTLGAPIVTPPMDVSNGLFTVTLDFGDGIFTGANRWLDIEVHANDNISPFASLTPNQPLTPTPYALFAPNAGVADIANGVSSSTIIQGQALLVGISNSLAGTYATISGGGSNTVSGSFATVAGGFSNIAISNSAAILGGSGNIALGDHAVVVGGEMNAAIGDHAFVGGGAFNSASGYDVVSGGFSNRVSADTSGIGSGMNNYARGYGSWIGGGQDNQLNADYSAIGGGKFNNIGTNSLNSVISGGFDNIIRTNSHFSAIGGGEFNRIAYSSPDSTIAGGEHNDIGSNSAYSIVGGGRINAIADNSLSAAIAGGYGNEIGTNSSYSAIGGGINNGIAANSPFATIPGGKNAGARSFGQFAYASGTFVEGSTNKGDAQTSLYVLRGTTTNSSKSELFLDGNGSLSRSNRMIIATNGVWSFDILVVANDGTGAGAAGYQIKGLIQNNRGFTSLRSDATAVLFEDYPVWNVVVEHDLPHQALTIKVIGGASQTVRWVANVRTVELIF